jgi:hypothetical protein
MEAFLNDLQEYNLNNSDSRFLKHKIVRRMIRSTGKALFGISPSIEEWFFKKII